MHQYKWKIKKTRPNAKMPELGNLGDRCYDLFCAEEQEVIILPGKRRLINAGLIFELPDGFSFILKSRSGLAVKGIDVEAGVIDNSYRGEIKILLHNSTTWIFPVRPGDKIAQGKLEQNIYCTPEWAEEVSETERGEGGFGSTDCRASNV